MRLTQIRPTVAAAEYLIVELRQVLGTLIEAGYAHGDLSAHNVLVHEQRVVLIDLPQAVDLVANPQGVAFLRRDCVNICSWFQAHGVDASSIALKSELIEVYGNSGIDGSWSEQE